MSGLAKRRTAGVTGVLLLLMSLTLAIGLPAGATPQYDGVCPAGVDGWSQHFENGTGASGAWGSATWVSGEPGGLNITLNAGYVLEVCTKAGPGYNITTVTQSGFVPAPDGKELSHWAYRVVRVPDTTTSTTAPSTTTSTTAPTTTTSTTAPTTTTSTTAPTTTTSTTAPTTTTSTTAPTTTTSTTAPTTTTTQATTTTTQGTTTTSEASTTTSTIPFDSVPDVSVQGIVATAPVAAQVGPTTAETLPFTGASTGSMAGLAAALAAGGAILLVASRRVEEKSTERSWN